jgi:hypothetical protein
MNDIAIDIFNPDRLYIKVPLNWLILHVKYFVLYSDTIQCIKSKISCGNDFLQEVLSDEHWQEHLWECGCDTPIESVLQCLKSV